MGFKLKTIKAGWGPVTGDFEITAGDRENLHPLFVVLRDRRALLDSACGRQRQLPYVTESIKEIRDELTATLRQLRPNSEAVVWVEQLRAACREYLTAVESFGKESSPADFQAALVALRSAFRTVANHVAAYYELPAARELANDMARNPDSSEL